MMTTELFGNRAAELLLQNLRETSPKHHQKHIIGHLGEAERRELFSALMARAEVSGEVRVTGHEPVQLQFVRTQEFDVLPYLVLAADASDEPGHPEWGRNAGSEGFSSALRDYFSSDTSGRVRLLVTLTAEGNETQKSAQDAAVDRGLISLRALSHDLIRRHGLASREQVVEVVDTALDYRPVEHWGQSLGRIDSFLEQLSAEPEPGKWGQHLGALGCFLPDSSSEFASAPVPQTLPRAALPRRVGEATRLQSNAALRAYLAEDVLNSPVADAEVIVRREFDKASADAILAGGVAGLDALDFGRIRKASKKVEKNSFDWRSVEVRGALASHRLVAADGSRILLVAAPQSCEVHLQLERAYNPEQEYLHLFEWHETRKGPRPAKGAEFSPVGDAEAVAVMQPAESFSVYLAAITRGRRSYKSHHDSFYVVFYKTEQAAVVWEQGLALSLEHRGWVSELSEGAKFQCRVTLPGQDPAQTSAQTFKFQPDSAWSEQPDASGESNTLEGLHSVREITVGAQKIPARVCWVETSGLPEDEPLDVLEFAAYAAHERDDAQASEFVALLPASSDGYYLSGLTDVSRESGCWSVEVGGKIRRQVQAWNADGQEEAVAALLENPCARGVRRSADGALETIGFADSFVEEYSRFIVQREALFSAIRAKSLAVSRDDAGKLQYAQLVLTDLLEHGELIEEYYNTWLEAVGRACREVSRYGVAHESLLQTDILINHDSSGSLRRLTVLPTHPWLLNALLAFQVRFQEVLDEVKEGGGRGKVWEKLTRFEMPQVIPRRIVDDWFYGEGTERLRAEDRTPFHLEFLPAAQFEQEANLAYVAQVVKNKIHRYLQMHPHMQDARRTLRIGYVNPGDGQSLLQGLQDWMNPRRDERSADERARRTPEVEVLLFGDAQASSRARGSAFDQFFRREQKNDAKAEDLRFKLRYGKRETAFPQRDEDYVHICFAGGLIPESQYKSTAGRIAEGWDGGFVHGLAATTMRRMRSESGAGRAVSERGLWVAAQPDDAERQGLAFLLALLCGARHGMVDLQLGLYWHVSMPSLADLRPMYDHSDWVVHLDRELGLEFFRSFDGNAPEIIEYSDQEDPRNLGVDVVTLTNHPEPYRQQLRNVLNYSGLEMPTGASAEVPERAGALLNDINVLSGSWALDFLMGNITSAHHFNRLKGNVGSALVYRWLRQVEEPQLEERYDSRVVPVYLSMEDIVRGLPAAKLQCDEEHGWVQRYSNENQSFSHHWCDDLLVLYLAPAEEGKAYTIFGRIIEVKFGADARKLENAGLRQVRETFKLLDKHFAGGNATVGNLLRSRQVSLMIKSQLEQAVANGLVSQQRYEALNTPLLSAYLAAGNFQTDFTLHTAGGSGQLLGDVFVLSTQPGRGGEVEVQELDRVRVMRMGLDTVQSLAFEDAGTWTERCQGVGAVAATLPGLGRLGSTLSDVLNGAPGTVPGTVQAVADAEQSWGVRAQEAVGDVDAPVGVMVGDERSAPWGAVQQEGEGRWVRRGEQEGLRADGGMRMNAQGDDVAADVRAPMALADACKIPVVQNRVDEVRLVEVLDRLIEAVDGYNIGLSALPSTEDIDVGPRLLRVYLKLKPDQTISSVRGRSEDIARGVGVTTADIQVTNVTERRAIAVDLPMKDMGYEVSLEALLAHPSTAAAGQSLRLGFCAGIHMNGTPHWVDLAQMPHALVAGTTGSGKTIFLRTIILTMALNHSPEELILRFSSTKASDFSKLEMLAHAGGRRMARTPLDSLLLVKELYEEMRRRNELLYEYGCDNLAEYNAQPGVEKIARIVAVLDEYAATLGAFSDNAERGDFEGTVANLAAEARAAGIHLILCMQRPSSAILQGAIKSNIVHRFALKLPQNVDSRVVLDEAGAETLLGAGDLLYKDDTGAMHRLQVPNLSKDAYIELVQRLCE